MPDTTPETKPGFIEKTPEPRPPKSPAGFTWPTTPTPKQFKSFARNLRVLMAERGIEPMEYARFLYGTKIVDGDEKPHNTVTVYKWLNGDNFPRAKHAAYVAAGFKVPLARLIEGGESSASGNGASPKASKSKTKGKTKGNGNGADIEPRELPEGLKPATMSFKMLPEYPGFAEVTVSGVLQVEQAITLAAMLTGRH